MRIKKKIALLLTAAMLVTSVNISPFTVHAETGGSDNTTVVKLTKYGLPDAKTGTTVVKLSKAAPPQPKSGATVVKLSKHVHNWEYTADGATLTAKCVETAGTCSVTNKQVSITLSAVDADYSGAAYTGATISDTTAWEAAGLTVPTIKYVGRENTTYSENETAPTNAGTYTAKITVDSRTATEDFEIRKATPTVTAPERITTLVYSGQAQNLVSAGSTTGGTLKYSTEKDGTYTTTIPTGINAGTDYQVWYKVEGNSNYNGTNAPENPITISIAKKPVTISGITASNKTYDGTNTATVDCTTATLAGKVGNDELTVSTTGTFADKNAGTNKTVTLGTLTLGGTAKDNYVLATTDNQETTTASITAASMADTKVVLDKAMFTTDGETKQTVNVTVTFGETTLKEGVDYKLEGDAATEFGKYTLTITGKGNFDGEIKNEWAIVKASQETETVTPKDFEGKLTVTVTAEEGTPKVKVHTPINVLTPNEQAKLEAGKLDIDIVLTVKPLKEEDVNADSRAKIEKLTKSSKNVRYLDISIEKILKTMEGDNITGVEIKKVKNTDEGITITIDVPDTIPAVAGGYSRVYTVIRSHNDGNGYVAKELTTSYGDGKLTFTTDKFSDYAVMYVDTLIPVAPTPASPNTGDTFSRVGYITMMAVSALGVALVMKKKED